MFSENQQKIGKALLPGSKDLQQLRGDTGIPANELLEDLKGLLKKGVVEKDGDRYKLIEHVKRGVKMKDVEENFVAKMMIEGLGEDKESLERHMSVLEERLRKEPYTFKAFEKGEAMKGEDSPNYTAYFDVEVGVPEFRDLMYLVLNYGPSSIEVLEPRRAEMDMHQMQEVLTETASAVHHYAGFIYELGKRAAKAPRP